MARSATSRHRWRTLDSARIAGIVAAILVNVSVVVALTAPSPPASEPSDNAQAPGADGYLHWVVLPHFPDYGSMEHDPIPPCADCGVDFRPRPFDPSNTLQPVVTPAPTYPIDAFREGVSGTVVLNLLVDVDGRVRTVTVESSSGDRRLDRAALDQILHNWRFAPTIRNGVPVQAVGRVPVVFTVDGG